MFIAPFLSALDAEDQDFVEKIYRDYGRQLYAITYNILKNEQDAADALQETMLKIIQYIDKFTEEDCGGIHNIIMIGLHASIYNTSCRLYTKRTRISAHEAEKIFPYSDEDNDADIDFPDESMDTEMTVIREEGIRMVKTALLKLSQELRDTVNLVYFCGFSCGEAAGFLGISDSAVRNRLYWARKKLKESLKGVLDEQGKS